MSLVKKIGHHWLVIQENWLGGPTAEIWSKSVEIGEKPQTNKKSNHKIKMSKTFKRNINYTLKRKGTKFLKKISTL